MDDEERPIEDVEDFMLYAHEYAFWNVNLSYQGVPSTLKPIYIDLKMKEPVDIDVLTEWLPSDDVSELMYKHARIEDDTLYMSAERTTDFITDISRRMDWRKKMELVDKGFAQMVWNSEIGEPDFIRVGSDSEGTSGSF